MKMKTLDLIKKVEKLNKVNKELGFEDTVVYFQLVWRYGRCETVTTAKGFKKVVKDYIEETQNEILNTELTKEDKFVYKINDEFHINLYKERIW